MTDKKKRVARSVAVERKGAEREIVLLAVTGMSPAILTETVWALAHEEPSVIPNRIIVLTTARGRKTIEKDLFSPLPEYGNKCVWDALRDELTEKGFATKGKLQFGPAGDFVRVLAPLDEKSGRQIELDDIVTARDNEAMADFILDHLRSFTENPDISIVASMAGGRKTMGALLYAAMNLLGRESDRLTHILVSEPFESPRLQPRFYFPGQLASSLSNDGQKLSAKKAVLQLADVPFVPLRNLFPRQFGRLPGRFSALVRQYRESIGEISYRNASLKLNERRCEIEVNGKAVRLAPRQMVLMLFLARRAAAGEPAFQTSKAPEVESGLAALREQLISRGCGDDYTDWRHSGITEIMGDDIRKLNNEIKNKLRCADAAELIPALPAPGRLSLDLAPKNIKFVS